MEIKSGQAEAFLRGAAKAKDGPRLILLFGNDDGLVAERGKALAAAICADLSDPFRVVDISGDARLPLVIPSSAASICFRK